MSAPDDDPMHAQLSRLCDVVDRLVRVVVRVDELRMWRRYAAMLAAAVKCSEVPW